MRNLVCFRIFFYSFPCALVGTPVISTDCPSGPSEILTDYPELLSPVGDIDALARNMRQYYNNPPAIDNRFLEKFSIETILSQLEKAVSNMGE